MFVSGADPKVSRLAIFDLDGTLIDSRRDIAEAANVARMSVGLAPLMVTAVAAMVGDGLDALIARLIPESSLRPAAKQAFGIHYGEHCWDHTRLYPGVAATVAALAAAGWVIAVATNKPTQFARDLLERSGLARLVGELVRGGDRTRKPDPGQLLDLLAVTGIPAARAWMIGDHHTDIRAARAAQVRMLWCAWGFGDDAGEPVDASAATPADWLRILSDYSRQDTVLKIDDADRG